MRTAGDDWQQIRRLGGYYDPNFMFTDAFVAKRLGITIEEAEAEQKLTCLSFMLVTFPSVSFS